MNVICTLPRCTKQFEPRRKNHRFCCAAHRAAFAYLPIAAANEARKLAEYLADLPRKNEEFTERNRYRSLGFDGVYGGPEYTDHAPRTTNALVEKGGV